MLIKTNPVEIGELFAVANKEKTFLENEIKKAFRLRDEQLNAKNEIIQNHRNFIQSLRDELYREGINDEIMLHNVRQIVEAEYNSDLPF